MSLNEIVSRDDTVAVEMPAPVAASQHLNQSTVPPLITRSSRRGLGRFAGAMGSLFGGIGFAVIAATDGIAGNGADLAAVTCAGLFVWAAWPIMHREFWWENIDDHHPDALGSLDLLERNGRR
ncbi:hypothetical protein ACIGCK_04880 [Microbacterium sp. NPDC078428]|uniref:hypothetical protein n=1 Tax=Microbacterium sp. NPDC078428 TaxID=3364190 RepID=UPI0037C918D7